MQTIPSPDLILWGGGEQVALPTYTLSLIIRSHSTEQFFIKKQHKQDENLVQNVSLLDVKRRGEESVSG